MILYLLLPPSFLAYLPSLLSVLPCLVPALPLIHRPFTWPPLFQDVILSGLHRTEFMGVCENFPYAYERMHAKAMEELVKVKAANTQEEIDAASRERSSRSSRITPT